MCGIAGIFRTEGATTPADRLAIGRMNVAQRHRGPDDSGLFQDASTVLGHSRLSIIDLSPQGHQPMCNENRTVWVSYNGEIYNFRELVGQLGKHRFASQSDTEVLIHGYEEWGIEGLLARLRGMFAFAIYDSRARRLLLARDRFGIKPLYYHACADSVAFASEVKALVGGGLAAPDTNPAAMTGLLLLGSVPAPETRFRNVRCLLPGHYLDVTRARIAAHKYGEAKSSAAPLAQAIEESVARHLISDVPAGVFLSGGVDSAALVALATRARPSLTTLTVTFDEAEFSEAGEARAIAEAFHTDHREVRVTGRDFLGELPNLLRAMDQPTNDGVNTYFVSRAARQAGLKVALSGLGGDEVFGGYKYHRWFARHGQSIRRAAKMPAAFRRTAVTTATRIGRVRGRESWMRLANLQDGINDAALYLSFRGFFAPHQVRSLLDVDDRELRRATHEYLTAIRPPSANGVPTGEMFRYLERERYLHDQLLRDTDVFSMAHSLEVRVPFLDHAVAEAAAGSERRCPQGNKPLLTEAVSDAIVTAAAQRSKRGFTFPFATWMRQQSASLREMALAGGCLNRAAVSRLWSEFDAGRLHWSRAWMLTVLGSGK